MRRVYYVCSESGADLEYEHLYGDVESRIHASRSAAERAAARVQEAYEDDGWERTAWVESCDLDDDESPLSEEERQYAADLVRDEVSS